MLACRDTRDKCGRNPKNAKHDSETILNDSPKGEVSSWRANQQPIWNENRTRASLKRKQSDLGSTMQIVIDHDDDD